MFGTHDPVNQSNSRSDDNTPTQEENLIPLNDYGVEPVESVESHATKLRKFKVKSPVNIRVTPDAEAKNVIGVLKIGYVVAERECPLKKEGWTPVTFERYEGWVKAEYLEEV